jgi:pyruvate/2-oxoglutarate/acetoin dehydrogenase E1 component/TPP-dependent pyruvate/acetoin dehydrogenase alpha subunit
VSSSINKSSPENIAQDDLLTKSNILTDYRIAVESRLVSYTARKDVFMGRAKFGITGDGKELPQLVLAKFFKKGDWRSGYYRDQTLMAAIGELTWNQYFAQLYAHTDVVADPHSAGRSMNGHYGNKWFDENGDWLDLTETKNAVVDIAPTAGQMPRAVGLGYASKIYRENEALHDTTFSNFGNEVCYATIGDASTSQGMFFESINAAGVLQIPVVFSVWDDGYGISVPIELQTTKSSISKALAGFQRNENEKGLEIIVAKAWDYIGLIEAYSKASSIARKEHVPVLVHVIEVTQPQGHSASGSHERYKPSERLLFEKEYDCNEKFKQWILINGYASVEEIEEIEKQAEKEVKKARNDAWQAFRDELKNDISKGVELLKAIKSNEIGKLLIEFEKTQNPNRRDIIKTVKQSLRFLRFEEGNEKAALKKWVLAIEESGHDKYSSWLTSESKHSPMHVPSLPPIYGANPVQVDGREIINQCFDNLFATNPSVIALGEDVGFIGDVNQGFVGLQEKYGEIRITDTGIRETTIIGQGIGAAMRGLRPIVEIQYLDYVYYALATLTDDLASLSYRTKGGQKAPLIIRTRGHRLEGIWHSGSPMAVLLHSLRGIHILVPRNFVQATGFYNTIIKGDDPALIVEPLNGYRQKENLPTNLSEITLALGIPETIRTGQDITIVTYGSMCRIVMEAAEELQAVGISVEVIDVQSLLPFDINHQIVNSLKKTNRVIFADEDMPGGATAFMMQEVLENQDGYRYLDAKPITVSAKNHRPAYASDGDYFSKPSVETVFDAAYQLMHEAKPSDYPN